MPWLVNKENQIEYEIVGDNFLAYVYLDKKLLLEMLNQLIQNEDPNQPDEV